MRNVGLVIASCVALFHVVVVVVFSSSCRSAGETASPALQRFEFSEPHMGSPVRLVFYASDRSAAAKAASAAYGSVAAVDAAMSDYRADSEVSRLAAIAGHGPLRVSKDLANVLVAARRVSESTGGAFDVTVGPLVSLWREARRSGRLPDADALATALSLVGYRRVEVDAEARTARLASPGMRLDMGGIGKGYAADRALAALAAHGSPAALVEAGGDIALGAPPPGRSGWRIDVPGGGVAVVARRGVSTSGDLEQFVLIGGRRYSHVVDPRTGIGVQHVATVTVIASDATTSDAFASALGVVGRDRALTLAESIGGLEARFRWRDGESVVTEETSGFTTEP